MKEATYKTIYIIISFLGILLLGCGEDQNVDLLGDVFLDEKPLDSICLTLTTADYRIYDIPESCFKTVVDEPFDNEGSWFTGSQSGASFSVSGGKYNANSTGVNFYSRCDACNGRMLDQFQIEVDLKVEQNGQYCSLNWGGLDLFENVYRFGINGQGEYTIGKNMDGMADVPLVPLTASAAIQDNESNKLTIRHIQNISYFFINEQLVHEQSGIVPFGTDFSLTIGSDSEAEFDNLKLLTFR